MTLGIAIPTYSNHIKFLKKLLYVISKSSVLPTQVSVSISSYDGKLDIESEKYPFELIITKTIERKNPSQNRNIAASKLSTEIISFIDGDDLPHLKRNEFILKSFEMGCDSVVHNYFQNLNHESDWVESEIQNLDLYLNYIDTPTVSFAISSKGHKDYHCAHISLKKKIFDYLKYNESEHLVYSEDSAYTTDLVKNNIKISYISNKLSLYNK